MAVIGAFVDGDNGIYSGSAYLYDMQSGQQISKLLPDDGSTGAFFGQAVGISETTVVVSSLVSDVGFGSGTVYMFDASTGQQTARLVPDDAAVVSYFGSSIAIDGASIVVGAYNDSGKLGAEGAAYVFDALSHQQVAKLIANDRAAADYFGWSVAIHGTIAVVGAPGDDDNGLESGSAYLFDVTTGEQVSKLVPDDGAALANFGANVAIHGAVVIVGALFDDAGSGAAYVFDATTGEQTAKLLPGNGAPGDYFGSSVAVSQSTAIVGAYGADGQAVDAGAVYLFGPPAPVAYCTAKANSLGCPAAISSSGAAGAGSVPFWLIASPVINRKNGLLIYGTSGRAAIPLSGGLLCTAPPLRQTPLQISGGSSPPTVDCTGAFAFDFNAWLQLGLDPNLVPGQQVNAQYWWRDPGQADGTGVALTDALEFTPCP